MSAEQKYKLATALFLQAGTETLMACEALLGNFSEEEYIEIAKTEITALKEQDQQIGTTLDSDPKQSAIMARKYAKAAKNMFEEILDEAKEKCIKTDDVTYKGLDNKIHGTFSSEPASSDDPVQKITVKAENQLSRHNALVSKALAAHFDAAKIGQVIVK